MCLGQVGGARWVELPVHLLAEHLQRPKVDSMSSITRLVNFGGSFLFSLSLSLRLEKVKQLHVTAPPNVFSLATFRLIREGFPSLQEMVWKVEEQNGRKWQYLVSPIYELENTNAKIYFQLMRVIPAVLLLSSIGFFISYIFQ